MIGNNTSDIVWESNLKDFRPPFSRRPFRINETFVPGLRELCWKFLPAGGGFAGSCGRKG